MSKKYFIPLIFCIILVVGVFGSFLVMQRPDTNLVEIVQDGRILYTINLSHAEDQIWEVDFEGRVNTIEIKDHQIRMLDAECPDHTCVNMGWLNSSAPIVCLPNHLVIRFADDEDVIDGFVGT